MTNVTSTEGIDKWVNDAINYAKINSHSMLDPFHFLAVVPNQPINLSIFGVINVDVITIINMIKVEVEKPLPKNMYGSYAGTSGTTDAFFKKIREMVTYTGEDHMSSYHILMALSDGYDFSEILNKNGVTKDTIKKALSSIGEEEPSHYSKLKKEFPNVKDVSSVTEFLDRFSTDLTELADNDELEVIVGRDDEIRTIIKLLSRQAKNNPVIVGEPGTGKTAIVEGLAQRIVKGDIPKSLKNKKLYSLDLTSLVAGAKMRGEFEERFQKVLNEVRDSDGEIILFIDEIHAISSNGAGDILKPALARGNIRLIGATTNDEYRQHIETDAALDRRFQKVSIKEPSVEDTITILRGIVNRFQNFHQVRIEDGALVSAAKLSNRYVTSRKLPDKAIDVIDEAAAKMRMELDSAPAEIDSLTRKLNRIKMEEIALSRAGTPESLIALSEISTEKANIEERLMSLKTQWKAEQEIRERIINLRKEVQDLKDKKELLVKEGNLEDASKIQYETLKEKEKELIDFENSAYVVSPLVSESVGQDEIAEVIESWTGIPVSNILESEAKKLVRMETEIAKRLIGQQDAVKVVSNAIRRSRAGVADPKRPTGSFLFLGTSGSGKTLLCKALAGFLFDNENAIVRVDMSEFSEKHSVARLIGAPPGYVGYEAGGQLTEEIRNNPYSVILLDEVEKAHPEIFDILLQVLDDGRLTDGQGRTVNFKNTIIVLTSNLGSEALIRDDFDDQQKEEYVNDAVRNAFRPEFLNRLDETVIFKPFTKEELGEIVNLEVSQFVKRLESRRITFDVNDSARTWLATEGYDPKYGARPLRRLIQREIGDQISLLLLEGYVDDDDIVTVTHKNSENGLTLTVKKREWANDISDRLIKTEGDNYEKTIRTS